MASVLLDRTDGLKARQNPVEPSVALKEQGFSARSNKHCDAGEVSDRQIVQRGERGHAIVPVFRMTPHPLVMLRLQPQKVFAQRAHHH